MGCLGQAIVAYYHCEQLGYICQEHPMLLLLKPTIDLLWGSVSTANLRVIENEMVPPSLMVGGSHPKAHSHQGLRKDPCLWLCSWIMRSLMSRITQH